MFDWGFYDQKKGLFISTQKKEPNMKDKLLKSTILSMCSIIDLRRKETQGGGIRKG